MKIQVNGWTLSLQQVIGIVSLIAIVGGVLLWAGEVKAGFRTHEVRIDKLETKQDAIWEMVRTQHVFDSLTAIANRDTMFIKAVNIVNNGHDSVPPDTIR